MRVEQSSYQQQQTQPQSIQDNFVRKYQSLLSSGNFKNIRSPYFQYSEGFTDPLPTGGSGGGGDIRSLESIEFPEFNQSQLVNQPLTSVAKKPRKKAKGGTKNKGGKNKATKKSTKKKSQKLSKNQIIGKLLKELTSTKKKK